MYRTTPLHGLFVRAKPGFYHDGRFADYRAVVDHYDGHFRLGLSEQEKADLIEYFKTFGFRVEGFAPNRYSRPSGAAELIMAKHVVRDVVRTPAELESVVDHLGTHIWGLDSTGGTRFGVTTQDLSVPALLK